MNRIIADYHEKVETLLDSLAGEEKSLERAAALIADAYNAGRTVYIFGCTHSAILAEDVFYRAGAPAFWRPLWGPGMSIATTPGLLTSALEHSEEVGNAIIACSRISRDDVLLLISTSGKNGAPVAVADAALKRGAKLILLTSSAYQEQKGNHSGIPNLHALADKAVLIDNHVPCGDASIHVGAYPMGPLSTIAGSFLLHALSALAVEKIASSGKTPPVFLSSNAPGGLEHNRKLLEDPALRNAFLLP